MSLSSIFIQFRSYSYVRDDVLYFRVKFLTSNHSSFFFPLCCSFDNFLYFFFVLSLQFFFKNGLSIWRDVFWNLGSSLTCGCTSLVSLGMITVSVECIPRTVRIAKPRCFFSLVWNLIFHLLLLQLKLISLGLTVLVLVLFAAWIMSFSSTVVFLKLQNVMLLIFHAGIAQHIFKRLKSLFSVQNKCFSNIFLTRGIGNLLNLLMLSQIASYNFRKEL